MSPASAERSISVCGLRIPVRVGTNRHHPGLEKAYACFDEEQMVIWVHADCPAGTVDFWIAHETLHALFTLSGVVDATAAVSDMARGDARLEAWEEASVRALTPHVLVAFGPPARK